MNLCTFSPCRRYRYDLVHRWDQLTKADSEPRLLCWIGLNPSTADEQQLDPTLRRVKSFSLSAGYDGFVMLNLFAFRATKPEDMMAAIDPVGRDNDAILQQRCAQNDVVVAWGNSSGHLSRWRFVVAMLEQCGARLQCLGTNADGSPKHPLYIRGDKVLEPWTAPKEVIEDPWVRRRRARALRRAQA